MKTIFAFLLLFSTGFTHSISWNKFSHVDESEEVAHLQALISTQSKSQGPKEPCYVLKAVQDDRVILEDDSVWKIGYWYTSVIKEWKKGDKLKLSYYPNYSNNVKIEHMRTQTTAWGILDKAPKTNDYIARKPARNFESDDADLVILNSGWIYKTGDECSWKVRDHVFTFHEEEGGLYTLWNISANEIMGHCQLLGNEKEGCSASLLNLEKKLNERVLGQKQATEAIKAALFNYWIGINDPKMPIGVFLFLGPTGVGKTEMAKALTEELYKTQNNLIRFDMSHFAEYHTASRLIGSPPGYVNHEEGGQLTEALRSKPRSVVLLDEMEKAHTVVRKMFLPVFDEGYICDAKNRKIPCKNTIFIMTSNICAQEIAMLFNKGYSGDDVLRNIEPTVMEALSPELYNRTIPIVFHALTPDLMQGLVDLQLQEVTRCIAEMRRIQVVIDESARNYLIKNGFHPTLGARPLKRLIQKEVVASLSYAIVIDSIPENSLVTLSYSPREEIWRIHWERI